MLASRNAGEKEQEFIFGFAFIENLVAVRKCKEFRDRKNAYASDEIFTKLIPVSGSHIVIISIIFYWFLQEMCTVFN